MKETTLSKLSSYANPSAQYSDAEENQVDTISTSSRQDDQDSDECDTDGAIVIANEEHLPSFGSLSVVNSNDVQIGNRTVYQGPVTIKQFVYPNGAVSSDCVSGLEEFVNKIDVELSTNGIVNHAYVKDTSVAKETSDKVTLQDNTNAQQNLPSIRKGLLWLQNLRKQHKRDIVIFFSVLIVSLTILTAVIYFKHPTSVVENSSDSDTDTDEEDNTPVEYSSDSNITINRRLRMVSRLQWLAQPPIQPATPLKTPVPLVIIQHTATESCATQAQCVFQVRIAQQFHIESNGWWDIGYNFLVGGDGSAYEGRGWKSVGAHTLGYNNISIGVGFVGTFSAKKPPLNQIVAFKKLVELGVQQGYIRKDYKIIAARQVHATESPGTAFYKEIQTWPHWAKEP